MVQDTPSPLLKLAMNRCSKKKTIATEKAFQTFSIATEGAFQMFSIDTEEAFLTLSACRWFKMPPPPSPSR